MGGIYILYFVDISLEYGAPVHQHQSKMLPVAVPVKWQNS
jgi:hypothetical protein